MGFGPITNSVAKRLAIEGCRVGVVTDSRPANFSDSFQDDDLYFFRRSQVVELRLHTRNLFISWREIPLVRDVQDDVVSWLRSENASFEKILHLSSASVYPKLIRPAQENDFKVGSKHKLENNKQILEAFVRDLADSKALPFLNLRISNVYGEGLLESFIYRVVNAIKDSQPVRVYASPFVRDYVSLSDVTTAIASLAQNGLGLSACNISTGVGTDALEIVNLVERIFGVNCHREIDLKTSESTVTHYSVLDNRYLNSLIGWRPSPLFQELSDFLERARRN